MKHLTITTLIITSCFFSSHQLHSMARFRLLGRAYAHNTWKNANKNLSPKLQTIELIELQRPTSPQLNSLSCVTTNNFSSPCTAIIPYKAPLPCDNIIEQACFIIKPDAVVKSYVDPIIQILQQKGFSIGYLRKKLLTPKEVESLYDHLKNKPFFQEVVQHMTSGCCFVLTVSKKNGIYELRKLIGALDQDNTIRGEFGSDKTANAVHGSDSPEAAQREIKLFFKDE